MRFGIAVVATMVMFFVGSAAASAEPVNGASQEQVPVATVNAMIAQANCTLVSISGDGGAFGCWNPTGEHLYNCDNAADGHHPELYYYRSTSPNTQRHVSDSPTAGNCVDHDLADIPESGWVDVLACNYEGSTALSCDSAYRRASANG
jgi:hypothetical protein